MIFRVCSILLLVCGCAICSDSDDVTNALVGRWICDETKTRSLNPEATPFAMDLLLAAETQWEFSKDGTLQSFSRLARPTPKTVWRQQESSDDQDKTIEVKIRERWIKLNIRFEDGFLISRTPGAEKEIPGHPSYMAFRKLHPESDASPQSAEQDDDGN